MKKMLFLDYSQVSTMHGWQRILERPAKHSAQPLLRSEMPWEHGNFTLYGSIIKVEGKPYQMWYSVVSRPLVLHVAYAESDDGIHWNRPLFNIFTHEGRQTNIVLDHDMHGAAVLYDEQEPRENYKYKMVGGVGGGSKAPIHGFHSPDGIHWKKMQNSPIITAGPDCPMGLLRHRDGRYIAYHRKQPFGRKIFRSESWDFQHWSGEPRLVLEPDAGDPPMTQFYGLGSVLYGPYEIGTLWMFHIDPDDESTMNGYQEAELAYARSGYAWHRAAQGQAFIPHGAPGEWDQGNLQCASSPLFLKDEIRYYYAGTDVRHKRHWEHDPHHAGLGMATLKPDRFMALSAGDAEAELVTIPLYLPVASIRLNAHVLSGGWIRVEVLDLAGNAIADHTLDACTPITGDSIAHQVRWSGTDTINWFGTQRYRLRIRSQRASLYAIYMNEQHEAADTHEYRHFTEFDTKTLGM